MKPWLLVLLGVLIGCATTAVMSPRTEVVRAQGVPEIPQFCTSTRDYNNVQALDKLVRMKGQEGWELIGVYRPTPIGATLEDYACFKRPR